MAKKLKKLLAVTLALSMTMSLLNLTAFAKGPEEKSVQVGEEITLKNANSDGTTRQDIDTLPSNTDPLWSVEDDSIASLTDNEDGTATLTGEAAGQAVVTRVTYAYKWVGEENGDASLSYYDLDDADPDTMTPVEVTTTWTVSVESKVPSGGLEDGSVSLTVNGADSEIPYKDGTALIVVNGGDQTIKSVTIDGEIVLDNAQVEGDGADLPNDYTTAFTDGKAHTVAVELGYKLVMRTWYVDFQKSLSFNLSSHASALVQLEAAQVDPSEYPAKTVTYVIPSVSDGVEVDVLPEESGVYVHGIMSSAFGYSTMDFRNSHRPNHVVGDVYYNTFPFHGAPDKGNNTYGFHIDSMQMDHIVEFPVRLFPLMVDYIPVLEQVDGSKQYLYGENPTEYPANYWMHRTELNFVVDGSQIQPFGAIDGYRLNWGYFWGGRWGSYDGDHIFHTDKNGEKVNYLQDALGLTIDETTGEISGAWKLVDEVNYYESYMEYRLLRPVSYHANGGSGTMDPVDYVSGETVIVGENGFTNSGYVFTGWNTAADGSGTSYQPGDTFEMGLVSGVTLYAQWEKAISNYTITVKVNWYDTTTKGNGSQPSGQPVEALTEILPGTYVPGAPVELDFTAYHAKYPNKSLHSLSAGSLKLDVLFSSPTSAGYSNGVSFTMPSKDVIVYLNYTDKGTTFNQVGLYETVSGDYSDTRYTTPDYNNWSAEDLFLKQHGTAVEIMPRAAEDGFRWYASNAYTYHFNTGALTAFPLNVADAGMGALSNVSYDASNGTLTGISRPIHGDYAFYLYHYYQMLRPVSYHANGGEGTMETLNYVKGDAVSLAENSFTRSGYTFTGWNTASDGSGTAYQPGDTFTMGAVEGVTLYAQWEEGHVIPPVYYSATVNYLAKDTGTQIADSHVSNAIQSGASYDVSAQKLDSISVNGVTYAFDSQSGDALSGTMDGDKVINLYYVVSNSGNDDYDDDDDDDTPPVVIPDNPPPTTDQPPIEEPVVDIPTEEVPKADLPPADLADEEVPLADVPATGDASLLWLLAAVLSGSGLVWLTLSEKRRKETEL